MTTLGGSGVKEEPGSGLFFCPIGTPPTSRRAVARSVANPNEIPWECQ